MLDTNIIACRIHRHFNQYVGDTTLCGITGERGVGILYEAVKFQVNGRTFLIQVKELDHKGRAL